MPLLALTLFFPVGSPGPAMPDVAAMENRQFPLTGQPQNTQRVIEAETQALLFQADQPAEIVRVVALSEFPIVDPQAETEITFSLQNISAETWWAGDYSLVNMGGQNLTPWSQVAMDVDVPSGHYIEWSVPLKAPDKPGIYRTTWQFSYRGVPAGPPISADLIVIPAETTDAFRAAIRTLFNQAVRNARHKFAEVEAELKEVIEDFVTVRVRPNFYNPFR